MGLVVAIFFHYVRYFLTVNGRLSCKVAEATHNFRLRCLFDGLQTEWCGSNHETFRHQILCDYSCKKERWRKNKCLKPFITPHTTHTKNYNNPMFKYSVFTMSPYGVQYQYHGVLYGALNSLHCHSCPQIQYYHFCRLLSGWFFARQFL